MIETTVGRNIRQGMQEVTDRLGPSDHRDRKANPEGALDPQHQFRTRQTVDAEITLKPAR